MDKRFWIGAAALTALVCTQPAAGQAWIGQVVGDMMAQQAAAAAEAACMKGTPPKEDERLEALSPSSATMQAYHAAMKSGGARSAFYALDKKTAWTHGETSLSQGTIDQGSDSFAAAGLALDAEPVGFVRSGLDATALGQWAVRDANGQVVGVYNAFLVRKLGEWKLRQLTLEDAADYSGPVEQFCHTPGDVLPYRLKDAERRQAFHGNRLEKAQAKLGAEQSRLAGAEAKLAERPDSASRIQNVERARAKVAKWQGEVTERQNGLDAARTDEQAALADQQMMAERRERARAELGITG